MSSSKKLSARKKEFIKKLAERGIRKDIIKLFADFDLRVFFDSLFEERFYTDTPVPVGFGQTGDDPYTLALMLHYLQPNEDDRVLEIGTGSGFSTALLSLLCKEVYTVEYIEELALIAKNRLFNYDFDNIRFYAGDATEQCSVLSTEFDKAIIHAGCRKRPLSVIGIMKENGLMVFPMGPALQQQILCLHNSPDEVHGDRFKIDYHEFCVSDIIKGSYGIEAPDTKDMLASDPEPIHPESVEQADQND
ncbi:MAG: protein-L-isoaspartate O-methyltransferase family protein [Spirochaetota bacterium]